MLKSALLSVFTFALIGGCSSGDHRGDDLPPIDTETAQIDGETAFGGDTGDTTIYQGAIPRTCEEIEQKKDDPEFGSTVGCEFYPVVLENGGFLSSASECAIVVGNVQRDRSAQVTLYGGEDGSWVEIGVQTVEPLDYFQFKVPCRRPQDVPESGYIAKGAHKLISDTPVASYQINPLHLGASADASLLIPTSNLDTYYEIVGWATTNYWDETIADTYYSPSYIAIAATKDATTVTVTPSIAPLERGPVPGTGEPFEIQMDEGDTFYIWGDMDGESFSGSVVQSNQNHPLAVFTGSRASFIPQGFWAADHLEEQMVSPRYWGTKFVASRMPPRYPAANPAEPVAWQIYAKEDNTMVTLTAREGVRGLPFDTKVMNAGELVLFYVDGTTEDPGDFYVTSTDATNTDSETGEKKPIVLMQYMTGSVTIDCSVMIDCTALIDGGLGFRQALSQYAVFGDPAMVYMSPIEQFLPHYVVFVPDAWGDNALIITRKRNAPVLVDGELLQEGLFQRVEGSDYVVDRVSVSRGEMHIVESQEPADGIGVIVVGWDSWDSYAYSGGMGMAPIAPPI